MSYEFKKRLKLLMTRHVASGEPNVFLHSMPRSGSTWLMELVLTQPGFMSCNEPLNLDKPVVRDHLGTSDWAALHRPDTKEKILVYFDGICSGRLRDPRFNRPGPFSGFYRPITRRVVFKVITAGQEYINFLAERLNGRVVFLIRHPVPVALSRKRLPMLEGMLKSEYRQFFTEKQLLLSTRIMGGDNVFARAILEWSLHNSVALQFRTDDWVLATYEQLVIDPTPLVVQMAKRLGLPKPERMINRLGVASRSTNLSDSGTQEVLKASRNDEQKQWLVEKWRDSVSDHDLMLAADILETFGLDQIYSVSDSRPYAAYWVS